MNVVGYTRVSTTEQGDSGLGLEAQEARIRVEATNRGWTLDRIYSDVASGAKAARPQLQDALFACGTGEASTLVVAKLDRLTRSLLHFAELVAQAKREGWNIVALDLGVDLNTPAGEMVANVMASFAQYERELIRQRTRDGLEAARARGVKLGAPRKVPPAAERVAHALRAQGWPLRHIRDSLDARGYGSYSLDTISRVLRRDPAVAA